MELGSGKPSEEAVMATSPKTILRDVEDRHTLSVIRTLIAAALSAAAVFLLCWISAPLPYDSPAQAYIDLFTSADYASGQALAEGLSWSVFFGGGVGAIFALFYNATAYIGRSSESE
jgi:hypothetical protein